MFERIDLNAGKVRVLMTDRLGGVSRGPYATFNLGTHVGDDADAVAANRAALAKSAGVDRILWLNQVHGAAVVRLEAVAQAVVPDADVATSETAGAALAIMVADCLPLILAARDGAAIAAAHAGWRGLKDGIVRAAVRALGIPPRRLVAWLGPRICAQHYEVDEPVRAAFADADAALFTAGREHHFHMDLAGLARLQLERLGVSDIVDSNQCVYELDGRYFSHRRDGRCGRCAALAWIEGVAA